MIIFFAISFWIHYLFREFTGNLWSSSRIQYMLSELSMNSLSSLNSLSFSQNDYLFRLRFTIFFTLDSIFTRKSLWMHYLYGEINIFTIWFAISLSFSQIHLKSIIFFAFSLWIHYLFRDFARNSSYFSRIPYSLREFSMNSLFSLNSLSFLRIHYLFRKFTLNPFF